MRVQPNKPLRACLVTGVLAITALPLVSAADSDRGRDGDDDRRGNDTLLPGNLLVSRTVYNNNPANVTVGEILPPDCAATTGGCSAPSGAPFDGTYPTVWNNVLFDASFGITSRIFLDEMTTFGFPLRTIAVPAETSEGRTPADHLVTSFSSKSELALNLSTDGRFITFMGYVAAPDTIDVSNSNTPGAIDITNPVGTAFLRAVAQMDSRGRVEFTETNAYSGNNGRAAILNNSRGVDAYYTVGNAGNGGNPQPERHFWVRARRPFHPPICQSRPRFRVLRRRWPVSRLRSSAPRQTSWARMITFADSRYSTTYSTSRRAVAATA